MSHCPACCPTVRMRRSITPTGAAAEREVLRLVRGLRRIGESLPETAERVLLLGALRESIWSQQEAGKVLGLSAASMNRLCGRGYAFSHREVPDGVSWKKRSGPGEPTSSSRSETGIHPHHVGPPSSPAASAPGPVHERSA